MTVTIVYDNNQFDARLKTAWGFACLIKGLEKTILFDTGGDGELLLDNMNKLNINPEEIDIIVLSHIHGDHTGGLASLLTKNPEVTVYVPASFPESFKNRVKNPQTKLVEVDKPVEICKHVHSTGEMGTSIKEQALFIKTAEGLVIITGCAHPGIVNMVRKAKELAKEDIYLVLGGFHLSGTARTELNSIIADFKELGVKKAAPCHCTGAQAIQLFKQAYQENFTLNGVGKVISVKGL